MTSDTLPPKKLRVAATAKTKRDKAAKPAVDPAAPKGRRVPPKSVKAKASTPAAPKPKRKCVSCDSVVSMSARYCRHCGKALSPEVPTNPHLPPPPKPWRPSRIPKQRVDRVGPQGQQGVHSAQESLQGLSPPLASAHDTSSEVAQGRVTHTALETPAKPPAQPAKPRLWDPVPEVEQKITQLRALHDRLRPQLARADLFKSRMRRP